MVEWWQFSRCENSAAQRSAEVLCTGKCFFIKVIHLCAVGFTARM
jgi:hypothetical protein